MKVWNTFFIVILLGLVALAISLPKVPSYIPGSKWFSGQNLHFGLDLEGGTHLLYEADISKVTKQEAQSSLEGVRDVIEKRVNALGVSEPIVQTNRSGDKYRLIVELAGIKDVNQAIKVIGQTPLLEFKEETGPAPKNDQEKQEIEKYNADALKKANEILRKVLIEPDKFADLAKQYSEDPGSKDLGGELPWAKRETFVKEFSDALFDKLQVGQITVTPVKSQFGYHIIKKEETRGDEVRARHILIATKSPRQQEAEWKNTGLTGQQLKRALVNFDRQTGRPEVSLEFNQDGKKMFEDITERNVNKRVGIFLDGALISSPVVQQKIIGGNAVITGNFTVKESRQLVERLNAGSLPVPITLISQQTIGPSLGKIEKDKSLKAGLIGLISVLIFMILYYRLPGFLAVLALGLYALLAISIFKIVPITLTLAGAAGFILSIGMAVDANVLVFERLKEELRDGRELKRAIPESFLRAWSSIRDSNLSSLISSGILIWFGTSIIKGFAITLAIGILVSMFTAITISRTLLILVSEIWNWKKMWVWGKSKKSQEILSRPL